MLLPLSSTILWSFKFTVVEFTVVVVPLTVKSPVTVRLSLTVTSDVLCPIDIGTVAVAVPIVIPLDVLELSMFKVDVLSNDMLEPSTTNVPSMSVLSKLVVPAISALPDISSVDASRSPATVSTPSVNVIKSVASVCPIVVQFIRTSSISKDPPEINPVVVIAEEPVSIVPNPDVIEPEFKAPVVTILLPPTLCDEK